MTTLQIKGPHVLDPANDLDAIQDIFIQADKIIALGNPPPDFKAEHIIDATNLIAIPGLVDLSVHLGKLGSEHTGTIQSETRACAHAGITTCCVGPDISPIIDTPSVADLMMHRAQHEELVRVLPLGALTQGLAGEHLSEMAALKAIGCVGVANVNPIQDTHILRQCFNYAATFDLTVHFSATDGFLMRKGCVHEGIMSTRLGIPGIPTTAETIGISRALLLQEETGVKLHFARVSTAKGLDLIRQAKAQGQPVTCDVALYHLFLSERDIEGYNSQCHVYPPLRSFEDQQALIQGFKDNVIDALCSHHRPLESGAKLAPFSETPPGISGLDSLLSLAISLAHYHFIGIDEVIGALTYRPSQILEQDLGTLSVGKTADICLFDPDATWTLSPETMVSQGHNTPFLDWPMQGQITHTFLAGRQVYQR